MSASSPRRYARSPHPHSLSALIEPLIEPGEPLLTVSRNLSEHALLERPCRRWEWRLAVEPEVEEDLAHDEARR